MVIETVFTLMCKDGGNLIISDAAGKGYCCKTVAYLLEVVDVQLHGFYLKTLAVKD